MASNYTGNMSLRELLNMMSEGNPGAATVLRGILKSPAGLYKILMLDDMDIRGPRLYKLNNDCCQRDPAKFQRTLMMIFTDVFTREQINLNLGRVRALPFIDDSIEMDGIPPYNEDFGPDHPKWGEWCEAQRKSFERRVMQ